MWEVFYEKAIRKDGSLFFPQRLTAEFLTTQKKTLGSYIFANQYQNEIIPSDKMVFKPEWIRRWDKIPDLINTFVFIDPAISLEENADYTAVVVVSICTNKVWYVRAANRYKLTASQVINKIFEVNREYKPKAIGIEDVAYQKALLHLCSEKMRETGVTVPLKGIKPDNDKSKEQRILGLVPRFEWSSLYLPASCPALEQELAMFPRAKHDDLLDALAYIDNIAFAPVTNKEVEREPSPHDPRYEQWYIKQLVQRKQQENSF